MTMTFGEAESAVPTFALEAHMTHNLNHCEQPVQKAGQKTGTALPLSPNPMVDFGRARPQSRRMSPSSNELQPLKCRMRSAPLEKRP